MRSPGDPRLDFLIELADMPDKMTNTATKRIQHLTRDTGRSLSHVCRGLVDLTRNLLKCGNAYVILGWFTTDPLEKSFSKLHQGSGGTYFNTAQSVIEKVRIDHAKLDLRLNGEIEGVDEHTYCCNRELNEEECQIIDNLSDLESNLSKETLSSLVYVAGYV